jgi:hypothetical protein
MNLGWAGLHQDDIAGCRLVWFCSHQHVIQKTRPTLWLTSAHRVAVRRLSHAVMRQSDKADTIQTSFHCPAVKPKWHAQQGSRAADDRIN